MPVMDGIAATKELRRIGVEVPIIGLTANADKEARTAAIEAGMSELLTKPISMASLKNIMARYQRRRSRSGTNDMHSS